MQSSPDIVFEEREDLVKALRARRKWAKDLDARRIREHAAAEKAYLETFKAKCRDALKWSYEDLKRNGWEVEARYSDRPSCPSRLLPQVDEALRSLALSSQKKFTLKPTSTLHYLLTFDENDRVEVC